MKSPFFQTIPDAFNSPNTYIYFPKKPIYEDCGLFLQRNAQVPPPKNLKKSTKPKSSPTIFPKPKGESHVLD